MKQRQSMPYGSEGIATAPPPNFLQLSGFDRKCCHAIISVTGRHMHSNFAAANLKIFVARLSGSANQLKKF